MTTAGRYPAVVSDSRRPQSNPSISIFKTSNLFGTADWRTASTKLLGVTAPSMRAAMLNCASIFCRMSNATPRIPFSGEVASSGPPTDTAQSCSFFFWQNRAPCTAANVRKSNGSPGSSGHSLCTLLWRLQKSPPPLALSDLAVSELYARRSMTVGPTAEGELLAVKPNGHDHNRRCSIGRRCARKPDCAVFRASMRAQAGLRQPERCAFER